jgi:hypothetical protein
MDFYLSDPDRQRWDNMLTVAETIESGRFSDREQVVHWVRTFPFAFLSDRSYIIARRMFEVDGALYGISKVIKHPQDELDRTVRMETYWSMWCCRSVPCPFGTGAHPASLCIRNVLSCCLLCSARSPCADSLAMLPDLRPRQPIMVRRNVAVGNTFKRCFR